MLRLGFVCLVLTGCALRPRYGELTSRFTTPDSRTQDMAIVVVDGDDVPVPGARIEFGERARFRAVTDSNGVFLLPLDKKYTEENALVMVVLPKGVRSYQLRSASDAPQSRRSEPLISGPQQPARERSNSAEPAEAPDAGVTTM